MAYGTVNADVIQTSTSGGILGAGNASIMKNRLINGSMVIDQRNAGASVTPTNGAYTLDRWVFYLAQASKLSAQQSTTAPVGFTNSLKITSLSAYSVVSTDEFNLNQAIEGFNLADLGWGTADAKTVTLSFWVQSSLTGTFGGCLRNGGTSRSYPFSYTISAANTWEQKSITIAGDTTGTWATNNTAGMYVTIGLGNGSTTSNTAGAWAAGNYTNATGATSVVGTSGATFYITGVQLEVGSSATGFEYRQYGQELALCQRYYEVLKIGTLGTWWGCQFSGASDFKAFWYFKVEKRASPTITNSLNSNTWAGATPTMFAGTTGVTASASSYFYQNGGATDSIASSASAEL